MAVCRAGALLELGEQGVADALGPGGSSDDKIIDGQFAAAEGCGHDPPSGYAEAGAIYVSAGQPQAPGRPFGVDDLERLGSQKRPQFTEHGQDIGGQPRVIGADVRELYETHVGLHCVTLAFGDVGAGLAWRAMAVSTVSASRSAITSWVRM